MIEATFHCNDAGHVTAFQLTGHAQSGPYGQDIVCAAASVISIGTINSLQEVAGVIPEVKSNDSTGGFLQCQVDYTTIVDATKKIAVVTLMDSCYQIMQSICTSYSEFIHIEMIQE